MSAFWRTMWVNAHKDLRIWWCQWYNIAAALLMPLTYVLVVWLGATAVGESPVALVIQDPGPLAQQMAQSLQQAQVFRVRVVDAATAQQLYGNLEVAAIVTIPASFDAEVDMGARAPIIVQADNFNLDLTNDLRRAVPDAISVYYTSQTPDPLDITIDERNVRRQDVAVEQFAILPMIVLLLLAHALISSGIATAREWEDQSIKELLLSPGSRAAILLGKMLAGFLATCGLGLVLFALGYVLGWTRPDGWGMGIVILIIALMSLFATGLGLALGSTLRRVQSVTSLATTCSVWLFFLSGGIGVIQFEPDWLKRVASFDPLTYGTHALQMATFYASADQLGQDLAVLAISTIAVVSLAWIAMRRSLIR